VEVGTVEVRAAVDGIEEATATEAVETVAMTASVAVAAVGTVAVATVAAVGHRPFHRLQSSNSQIRTPEAAGTVMDGMTLAATTDKPGIAATSAAIVKRS
jgi:hypothetical protein